VEGPVKERLTGALILVALLVIVVPEMLSGPGDRPATHPAQAAESGPPMRTYSLQLESASAARSQDQSVLSPRSVEAPVQATPADKPIAPEPATKAPELVAPTETDKPAAPASAASVAAPKPAPEQKPSPGPTPPVVAQWWAQLGSFASRDNAERLTRELRAAGYSVNLARVVAGGKELYRVRAGPEPTREAAMSLQARLAAAGHKSSLVAP
jgi:DedD protein